jgi:hypothetical protein
LVGVVALVVGGTDGVVGVTGLVGVLVRLPWQLDSWRVLEGAVLRRDLWLRQAWAIGGGFGLWALHRAVMLRRNEVA